MGTGLQKTRAYLLCQIFFLSPDMPKHCHEAQPALKEDDDQAEAKVLLLGMYRWRWPYGIYCIYMMGFAVHWTTE